MSGLGEMKKGMNGEINNRYTQMNTDIGECGHWGVVFFNGMGGSGMMKRGKNGEINHRCTQMNTDEGAGKRMWFFSGMGGLGEIERKNEWRN